MNAETEKNRQSTAPQNSPQSQQPRSPWSPIVSPTKRDENEGMRVKDGQDRMQKDGSNDDASEYPNPRGPGDKETQPIEGQRRDQGTKGVRSGEEHKGGKDSQNPGYSPFRPQGEAKTESGNASDRSVANRSSQQGSEVRPSGEAGRSAQQPSEGGCSTGDAGRAGKQESQTASRDSSGSQHKAADSHAPKTGSTSTSPKSGSEHKRDDDKGSRK
jgi:hypothetical protein